MKKIKFDIIIVGGGHAGVEAAFASSKMGLDVALFTMDINALCRMSCNPAIGGTAKGHIVKEIDALGGLMGFLADKTGIQFKMLNISKGPAVWSPRCQSDKVKHSEETLNLIENTTDIKLIQNLIVEILVEEYNNNNKYKYFVKGVRTENNEIYYSKCVILTAGTFLNAIMHTGKTVTEGGRIGERAAKGITESLEKIGFESGRLKTGTPPRLDINTIDFSKVEVHPGDKNPDPFSLKTPRSDFPYLPQVDCYLTHTNENTHKVLRSGFDDSPLFTGRIKGVGPRYCPSIEDKISRFKDKPRHQIFLEPETLNGNTIYMNGFSTSLPAEIQEKAARTVPGLERVKFLKYGYAVEYDFFPTHQIFLSLETKLVSGLFFAGQINGTSGYEEAAGQGIIAGINAALKLKNKPPLILKRNEAYIGVLIDDLINKCPIEPYRMFTSSAEYRLILRQDNADMRLIEIGYSLGLVEKKYYDNLIEKKNLITEGLKFIRSNTINPGVINDYLIKLSSSPITQNEFISNIVKRNNVKLKDLLCLNGLADNLLTKKLLDFPEAMNQIEIETKYEGYIIRQNEQIDAYSKNESIIIPDNFKYEKIKSLSTEALDKLIKIKPKSIGQASRIAGVNPSDITAILIYMRG